MNIKENLQTRGFFGRRKGRPLGAIGQELSSSLLTKLLLSPEEASPSSLQELFPQKLDGFRLEIGFGGGEHLLHCMKENPNIGFIGVEPFINGMGKFLSALNDNPELQQRIRLYNDDAVNLLSWLPAEQLVTIDLFYPDPWTKRRHWKRRFVNHDNLNQFSRLLQKDGIFRFASDINSYVTWTLAHIQQRDDFFWKINNPTDCYIPYQGWISTRYEKKALAAKRIPHYLTFVRQ